MEADSEYIVLMSHALLDNLDAQQQRAVTDPARRILVSAGAGSGKTRVLTARYLYLLEQHPRLTADNILSLTFTRKAAQEMRERITKAMKAQHEDARTRNDKAAEQRWLAEQHRMGRAPIGTIHSFCERLLREHALTAGIDPNFRLLDDAMAATLRAKALDEVLEGAWREAEQDINVVHLLLDVPTETLYDALLTIYGNARTHGHEASDIQPVPGADLADAIAAVRAAIEALLASSGTPTWMAALAKASDCYQFDLLPLLSGPWHNEEFWTHYDAATEWLPILTPRGGPAGIAKELRDTLKAAYGHWLRAHLDRAAEPYLQAMCLLLTRFDTAYQQAKNTEGLLDYEDLLLRARALLRDEDTGIAARYQARFAHVMVDEFQDTNPLQFAIINALCGPESSLFAVGDVKQSIYRFIGSDVRVFLAYEDWLAREGETLLPLRTNYRAHPNVLQPINGLFAARWPSYPERRSDGFTFQLLLSPTMERAEKTTPSCEFAFWAESDGGADVMRMREAEWIARRIRQLVGRMDEPALVIEDPGDRRPRDAEFSDIIVLFRVSTEIPRYAERLRAAGVPVYVVSGRGFYQAREIQDLLHLLRAVENPLDDFSLVVVLRSPLVGVSDDALYRLSHAAFPRDDEAEGEEIEPLPATPRDYGRIWTAIEQMDKLPQLAEDDRTVLQRFRVLLPLLQEMATAGQPLELLDEILDRTDYATCLLASDDGEQRYANVMKLREVAAAFQQWGLFDLADFRRHLANLQETAPREASAPLDAEKSQSVRLMTIHAAKGLEAPVIFLADCGWGRSSFIRQHQRFLYQPGMGLVCQAPTPESEMLEPAALLAIKARIDAEEAEEAERLLYVALTRARDHLVCTGFPRRNIMRPSYQELLSTMLEAVCAPAEGNTRRLSVAGADYAIRIWTTEEIDAMLALPVRAECVTTLWDTHADRFRRGEALPVAAGDVDKYLNVIGRFGLSAVSHRHVPLRVGVNRALCYESCPRQYWLRYLLHPEDTARGALPPVVETDDTHDDERERLDGTEFGTLLHGVMQRVEFHRSLDAQLPGILALLAQQDARIALPGEEAKLRDCLARLAASDAYAWLTRAETLHREVRFLAREDDVFYQGIIDVLGKDATDWWILDYKTGHFSPRHLRQVGIYALGVQAALGVDVSRVAVIYLDERDPGKVLQQRRVTPEFLDPLRAMLRGVGEGIRNGDFHPTPGRQCEQCAFRDECPAGRDAVAQTILL